MVIKNIEYSTKHNTNYRKVISTTKQMQLVYMNLKPFEEIGAETHSDTTQFIRVEKGSGIAIVGNKRYTLKTNTAVLIPSKIKHNIIAGSRGLVLYTLYSPPEHPKNRIQKTKK
jgi:mannose-6-phosphate isomerase-like protein (cupin superfamily)